MKIPSIQDCQDFIRDGGPTGSLSEALRSKLTAQQLRRMAREAQESMQKYLTDRQKARAAAGDDRLSKSVRESVKRNRDSKPATPAPRPLQGEPTDGLVRLLRYKNTSADEKASIRQELEARGVVVHPRGYSKTLHQ